MQIKVALSGRLAVMVEHDPSSLKLPRQSTRLRQRMCSSLPVTSGIAQVSPVQQVSGASVRPEADLCKDSGGISCRCQVYMERPFFQELLPAIRHLQNFVPWC